ncbi:MAG: hypothetical protein JF623_06885 [Acidobacteria bacterium]|nr:hypothetical protein [Acidobacteriota bacterium]
MEKKPRTPPPPKRPVQAPQRRDKRRGAAQSGSRNLVPIIAALSLVAIAAIAAALYFALRGNGSNNAAPTTRSTHSEYAHLNDRLTPLDLDANPTEVLTYHIHQHLEIFVNGKKVDVPAFIGINDSAYITELHTHAPDGIIHIEAPSNKHYTLGTFFAEWGIFLSNRCVGAYCQGYKWYVNGKAQTGSPFAHELNQHEQIVFAVGTPPKTIPSTYNWTGL